MTRSTSSKRWLTRQQKDTYVKAAKNAGYSSRAAFKLLEINEKDGILKPGMKVVDLGAAPGGWSEVAIQKVGEKGAVFALDILPMASIPRVKFIQGDFNEMAVYNRLKALCGEGVDLILSDIAPNISGNKLMDQARSYELAENALHFATEMLKNGGGFLIKLFQGAAFEDYLKMVRQHFKTTKIRKPKSSRQASSEVYLLGNGFRKNI